MTQSPAHSVEPQTLEFLPFTRPTIDEETIRSVVEVLRSGWLASGPKVRELEAALSQYVGGRIVRVVTSATEGLEIALKVCNIGPGDEVITPAMSFAATANVIARVGARPVFVDVGLESRNIDLEQVEAAITPRTRALMPVHFAGLPVDMDGLYALASKHGLRVIEDAAHAIGSAYQGKRIGSFGDIVVFSFHPNKNMTTIEGGALVLSDEATARAVEQQRWHGIQKGADGENDVIFPGGKSNLTDVAAAVGLGQLRRLEEFNAKRRALVARYFEHFRSDPAFSMPARGDNGHSWHIFAPLLPLERLRITRSQFIERMAARKIGVGVHYPALHLMSYFRSYGYHEGQFPNAERIGRETVTLPLFPPMLERDVDRVITAASEIVHECRR
jgi:dTDP-4-amino-4,6-dideoxygalactose transaminase